MIFSLFSRVVVKVGEDERHIFDRARLMYSEVAEIEKITGQSYLEWRLDLERFSITAVAALLHVLRKRAGMANDFATMQFNVSDVDVVPLNEDDTEMVREEWLADLERRRKAAEPDPTPAVAAENARQQSPATNGTSPSSPASTASARGNGKSSRGSSSAASKLTPTGS